MQTENSITELNYKSLEPEMEQSTDQNVDMQIVEGEPKHDHHTSAMYAASHVHSAVHHVKPHHNTRIEL